MSEDTRKPVMVKAYDDTQMRGGYTTVPLHITLACQSQATVDDSGGYPAYRCDTCNAIEGSIGMPRECKLITKLQKE